MNILLTGAGSPGGPGIIKELKKEVSFNVIAADINPLASGRFLTNTFLVIEKAGSLSFIDDLLEKCLQNHINIIVPLVTAELEVLSKNKKAFLNKGIQILVSNYRDLQIANDKGKILALLKEHNIGKLRFEIINTAAGLENAARNLGYPHEMVTIKPCNSNGSRGVRILNPDLSKFDQLFLEKPGNLNSTLEQILDAIGEHDIPQIVVSEYLPGEEITVDTILDNGTVSLMLIRTRLEMRSGISVSGSFILDDKISCMVERIAALLPGLNGPIGFQFKKSKDHNYELLEINPRLQGTSVAARGLGINFPLEAINYKLNGRVNMHKIRHGTSFSRYYDEIFY